MTTIFVDAYTKRLLDKIKFELRRKGYSRVTYSEAIRYLYLVSKKKISSEQEDLCEQEE